MTMDSNTAIQVVDLSKFYWLIGAVIVMNFGTIVSVFIGVARGIWWLSKLDARVEKNSGDINQAHKKIRDLETA